MQPRSISNLYLVNIYLNELKQIQLIDWTIPRKRLLVQAKRELDMDNVIKFDEVWISKSTGEVNGSAVDFICWEYISSFNNQ